MNIDSLSLILSDTLRASTPLILAALGELVTEKSGVLNLGVEGMMLVGAVAGFMATSVSGNLYLGLLAALMFGIAIALIHAVLAISLGANQVATGLAVTIFGSGLSLSVFGLYTTMGREYDSWTWLDCDRPRCLCHLETRTHSTEFLPRFHPSIGVNLTRR